MFDDSFSVIWNSLTGLHLILVCMCMVYAKKQTNYKTQQFVLFSSSDKSPEHILGLFCLRLLCEDFTRIYSAIISPEDNNGWTLASHW